MTRAEAIEAALRAFVDWTFGQTAPLLPLVEQARAALAIAEEPRRLVDVLTARDEAFEEAALVVEQTKGDGLYIGNCWSCPRREEAAAAIRALGGRP